MTGSGSNNECLGLFSSGMSTDKDGTRDVTKFRKSLVQPTLSTSMF